MAKTDSKIKKTRKMSNNKREKQYDENKLRIGKFYDINKCVERKSIGEQIKDGRDKVARNLRDPQFYKRQLYKRVPMVEWLMSYKLKAYLQADIVSGFTVGIMNIPQGMGYALLASLPPVGGLYISFFPLIVYAIFGTSRHLAIGSIAIVSLLSGGVVDAMVASHGPFPNEHGNGTDTDALNAFKFKVVCSLSLLVGILQVLMGVFGLGIVSSYFSHAFISGYTCGSAVQVLTSQIKDVFGLKGLTKYNGAFKIPLTIIDILRKMGTTNIPTLILSIISIIYLIIFKEFINPKIKRKLKLEFPSELLLVIVTTILSTFTGFQSKFKIDIVGTIPKGLPMPDMPDLSLWPNIIKDAIVIALIAFSINASLGTLFARKHKYRINPTQELVAYGLSNVFGSFFSCYPSAASLSRSSVLESTGGKTSLGPLLSSLVILVVILFLNPYFQPLPRAVLACIIVVALKNLLFQVKDLITYWKYSKLEAAVWLGAFLGVVLLDVDIGLIIGIVISLLTVIIKDQLLRLKQLKKYTDVYVDKDYVISKAPRKIETTDNKTELHWQEYEIFKVNSAIYFANCEKLKILLEKAIESREEAEAEARRSSLTVDVATTDLIEQKPSSSSNNVNAVEPIISEDSSQNYLILDFAAVNHTDSDGVKMLQQLVKDLTARKFSIYICQFQDSFIRMLHRMNLIEFFDPYLYLTIQEAVEDIESKNFDLVNASNF